MTNQERAEKIAAQHKNCPMDALCIKNIEKQFDEAVREAEKRVDYFDNKCVEKYNEGIKTGFASAKEQAAGIVDNLTCADESCCSSNISERIRAMEADK